jgi:hypothetical protein
MFYSTGSTNIQYFISFIVKLLMPNEQEIYIENFKESLKDSERFIRLSILCAGLLVVLSDSALSSMSKNESMEIGGVKLKGPLAFIVLLIGYISLPLLSITALNRCIAIGSKIKDAATRAALITNLSIATAPIGMKWFLCLLPWLLVIISYWVELEKTKGFQFSAIVGILAVSIPYVYLLQKLISFPQDILKGSK